MADVDKTREDGGGWEPVEDEDLRAGGWEPVEDADLNPSAVPVELHQEDPAAFDPAEGRKAPGSDFLAGLGNTMNLSAGAVRVGRALGLIDEQLAEDTLAELEADHMVRRGRSGAFGAGELAGNVAAGVAGTMLAPIAGAGGAAVAGGAQGGISELARTGDAGDAAAGTVTGALTGVAGHQAGKALGRGAQHLWTKTRAGEMAGKLGDKAARTASRVKRAGGMAGADLPAPRVAGKTFEEGMDSVPEPLAQIILKGPAAVRNAASRGKIGPQSISDALELLARDAAENASPRQMRPVVDATIQTGRGLLRAGSSTVGQGARKVNIGGQSGTVRWPGSAALAPYTAEAAQPYASELLGLGSALAMPPPMVGGIGEAVIRRPEVEIGDATIRPGVDIGEAQIRPGVEIGEAEIYTDALGGYEDESEDEGPSPMDDTSGLMFDAMREAHSSPALEAYPGVATELSSMLRGWAMGEEPAPSDVALMAYRLSEIPGLEWAALNPDQGGDDDGY